MPLCYFFSLSLFTLCAAILSPIFQSQFGFPSSGVPVIHMEPRRKFMLCITGWQLFELCEKRIHGICHRRKKREWPSYELFSGHKGKTGEKYPCRVGEAGSLPQQSAVFQFLSWMLEYGMRLHRNKSKHHPCISGVYKTWIQISVLLEVIPNQS